MRPRRTIDLIRPSALVAVGPGDVGSAVVRALEGLGMHVEWTPARGRPFLREARSFAPRIVVVELSRLGEPGLVGLSHLARSLADTGVVLLLPGGLGGPTAEALGLAAVLQEDDVRGLRAVAATCLGAERSGAQAGR